MNPIPLGIYRHYKGNKYEVIGFAKHSETLEDMVVYKALYGEGGTWARPLSMWSELVEADGKTVERFAYVADCHDPLKQHGLRETMNIFDLPALPLPEELKTILAEKGRIRIERIVSTGQVSDWYEQDETEFVVLLEGKAGLEYEDGKTITMSKGDTLWLKPYERHRVSYTSTEPPCIWLCVFMGERE